VLSKIDLYEANVAASETVGKATAAGQILVTDGVNSFVAVNNVTGLSLVGGTTSPSYAALGTNGYGDDTVTNAKLAPDSVGPTELQTDSVGTLELAPIAVTAAEIATSVAGAGLTGGAGTPLAVNTDNATIEVASDVVQLSATYRWEAGDIKYSARSTPTTGWLLCDGSAVNRTTYADLFTAIGTTYGVGDGSNTFNVPDYRGKSILGAGTGSGLTARTRGDSGGSETISTAELPVHTHTIDHNHPAVTSSSDGNHTHTQIVRLFGGGASGGAGGVVDAASYVNVNETGAAGAHTHSVDVAALTGNSGSTGSGDPHMPPFGVANVFIKT
jgi:microcystin-dependent protein